jgi:hypothetical protein
MDTVVAVSTLVLVAATCLMAWQARRQADITRQGVERAHRPVVVHAPPEGVRRVHDRPTRVEHTLAFPVRNIGMGPALNVRGGCLVFVGEAPWGGGTSPRPVSIQHGSDGVLSFKADRGSLEPHARLEVRLLYEDVSGRPYWTAVFIDMRGDESRCEVGEGELPQRLHLSAEGVFIGFAAEAET